MLSLWMMDQPFLGHKAPRPGRERLRWCPACWTAAGPSAVLDSRHKSTSYTLDSYTCLRHVLVYCPAVEVTRVELGIKDFLNDCLQAGRSKSTAFKFYIMGFDQCGNKIDLSKHLDRGSSLDKLTETWLSTWEDPMDVWSQVVSDVCQDSNSTCLCFGDIILSCDFNFSNLQT